MICFEYLNDHDDDDDDDDHDDDDISTTHCISYKQNLYAMYAQLANCIILRHHFA